MKKGSTELVFILDKSGSMSGLETDTIGGFNAMLLKQQALPDSCRITTVLFDYQSYLLHDRLELQGIRPMMPADYVPGGGTALLDAVGQTIDKIGQAQKHTAKEHRADKVLVVIITDGMENASRRYTPEQVRQMISRQQSKYGWEFLFLGANIDAVEVAGGMGIGASRAQRYHADSQGLEQNFRAMQQAVTSYRQTAQMPENWAEEIDKDFRGRGGQR